MKPFVFVLGSLLLLADAQAQTPAPGTAAPPEPTATPAPKRVPLKYIPPKNNSGNVRIDGDGGSRGEGAKFPSLYVLAPNGEALTTRAQPSLFYFQSGPAPKGHFKLTLLEVKEPQPIVKISVPIEGAQAGIRRIQLARQKVSLKPGVRYVWNIALGPGAESGSQDVVATGSIQFTEPSKELVTALAAAAPNDKAAVYAANGIWYDALEEISNQLAADPKNPEILARRAELLNQAGLKQAAAFSR